MTASYPPPASMTPAPRNQMALISLIVGIISWVAGIISLCAFFIPFGGLVCCSIDLIGSIVATVTGFMARNKIAASQGQESGSGMAVAGLVLGILGILASLLFLCAALLITIGVVTSPVPNLIPTPGIK